jgi:hypothetical protein
VLDLLTGRSAAGADVVDRQFSRRYDAARTVEAFAARLREQVDLDALSVELLSVVEQTMQPAQASAVAASGGGHTAKPVAAHTSSQTMLASQPDAQDPVRLPLSIGVRPIQRHVIKSTTGIAGTKT